MEILYETEPTFNDTEQRLNKKILNILRATTDPNFLNKSFQSNGSFQQVLPTEGKNIQIDNIIINKGIQDSIKRHFLKFSLNKFSFFRSRQVSNISSALLCTRLLRICHSFRKYFNILPSCLLAQINSNRFILFKYR